MKIGVNGSGSNGINESLLSIPKEVFHQIEEYGLDSMSILKSVLNQFQHLFNSRGALYDQRGDISNRLRIKQNQRNNSYQKRMFEEANVFTLNNKLNI